MARKRTSPATSPPRVAPGSARVATAIREQQRRIATGAAMLDVAGIEDVHDARVAARRLRSMLKTFRPLLDTRRGRLYRADLRSFARALGTAREADVRRELLMTLARDDPRITPAAFRRLGVLLDAACGASREQLHRQMAEPGWTVLCRALERHVAGNALLAVRDAELGDVVALVARAWRRPVRLLRRAPRTAAQLHELRLAFKHCRYALEPVADIAPEAATHLLRRLRGAQDSLGEHRDALLAGHWVGEHERELGPALTGRLESGLASRERMLRRRSVARAGKVRSAWVTWRDATRRLRRGSSRFRG